MNSQQQDEAEKTMALSAMAENFGKELSPELLDLWLNMLAAYPAAQVKLAIKAVIEHYEFKTLPPFAVLKKHLEELSGFGEKSLELQAIAEWNALLASIPSVGSYGRPSLHETTDQVVRLMGGWSAVCSWESSYLDLKRRDFVQFWKECHGRVEVLQLGANAVSESLALGQERKPTGPMHISATLKGVLSAGERAQ